MKSIALGQYYPVTSPLHRLDARMKVILAVLYIVCTFLCKNILAFAALAASALLLTLLARIPLRTILRAVRPIIFIMCFTAVLNIFFVKGDHLLFSWWKIAVFEAGLYSAAFMLVRIVVLIIGTSLFLTYTTTPIALTDAIESLLHPLAKIKVPVHAFAMMMTIALRFIPTIMEETEKIMAAQKARGADFTQGSLPQRAKALIPIIVPLFASVFRRADELATAMECRCYHGGEGRTKLRVLKYRFRDLFTLLSMILFVAVIVMINILGARYGWLYTM